MFFHTLPVKKMTITQKIAFWFDNARPISLPQSILPALLAISMAATFATFSWTLAALALFGVILAHLGMNLADDYFDHQIKAKHSREELAQQGMRARIAKSPYLTSGKTTIKELRSTITIILLMATIIAIIICLYRGSSILIVTAIGAMLGLGYSGRPFKLGYHGLGELVIAIMFGPLLMIGMQLAASGVIDLAILLISTAVGMLACNIVYTHSILDKDADKAMGKMTFARLLNTNTAMLTFSYIFTLTPFLLIIIGVFLRILSPAYAVTLVLLPIAIYLTQSIKAFLYHKPTTIKLHPWMGPMGDFTAYTEAGIEWFMLRWLLARNLITFFCLLLIVVNIAIALFA